ncbi:hypothetical protein INT46_010635 [Mucor plumbeus]|uniref:Uncharacterized protein n=1 Tax=Mucor plumbeus TaxID=97098 RepID=A0A8H7RGS0_9FUNG|nr:hypothetical protein INT46_010635 [Mucor plumbeus]
MVVISGESLLDAERPSPSAPHRITIKTDQTRWWPKTIYHTYWSRVSFWLRRNIVWSLTGVVIILIAGYLFLTPNQSSPRTSAYNASTESILKSIKEKFNDPSFLNYAPHQEKLKPFSSGYIAPDTYLNWKGVTNATTKVKAAFVAIVQEEEVYKLRNTMIELERNFNNREEYPWIIISDKIFSKKFREWITNASKAPVYFGQAPAIEWQEPYWVDIKKAERNMKEMVKNHDINSGEKYYWKVQAGSRYSCNIPVDPFKNMKANGQKLSFALTSTENHVNLDEFNTALNTFIADNKDIIQPTNASGGFFYHKWGDALPQTVAAGLFLKRSEISFTNIPGYEYGSGAVCPENLNQYAKLKCTCNLNDWRRYNTMNCLPTFMKAITGTL